MIIACPACATRYVVPDSAIGLEGRTVRCAKCKHSWFQDGPELAEPIAAAYAASPPAQREAAPAPPRQPEARPEPVEDVGPAAHPPPAAAEPPFVEPVAAPPASPAWAEDEEEAAEVVAPVEARFSAPAQDNMSVPEDMPPPLERPVEAPLEQPDDYEDEVSQFEHGPPFRPRRNWLRWLTWGAGAFAALALAAVVAMQTLGLPSWLPIEQPLFGADPGLTVEFPPSEQERRTLPNGAEFFGARVVVRNEARETKSVPPLLIVLRDARERVVYSWELVPPQRTLAPGEAMTINEAMTDVPKSAVYADIGWAPR